MKRQFSYRLAVTATLISAALAAFSVPAQAQMTTYTLQNVSFNVDGSGTASGFFEYDPTASIYGDFLLTTSDGSGASFPSYAGHTYDTTNSNAPSLRNGEFDFLSNDGTLVLDFRTSSALGIGGTYSITQSLEEVRTGGFGGSVEIINYRDGNNGTFSSAAAVPEASTLASFGLLLALGLGEWVMTAKKKAVSSD